MKRTTLLMLLVFLMLIAGCGKKVQPVSAQAVSAQAVSSAVSVVLKVAKPQDAVDAVYASLKSYKAVSLRHSDLKEHLGVDPLSVTEYFGKLSDQNEGLADVVILLPKEQEHEKVSLALSKYKEKRMASFENYDILDAYTISQNAVIYEQGGYIIMLMLSDNDAARKIIDEYIPL